MGNEIGEVGVAFSNALFGVKETIQYAKLAETKGFHSVWIAEDYFHRSAIPFLTAWATATTRIKVGVGVLPAYTRHITLTAMTMVTIDELSNGRMILGIGPGDEVIATKNLGYERKRMVRAMREYVETLRQLTDGKRVTYEGCFVKIRDVVLTVKPVRGPIPIYLAANQSQMLRLAGEVADGVLLSAGTSPEHVTFACEEVKIGAEKGRRDPSLITVAPYITSAVSQDANARLQETPFLKRFIARCLSPRYGDTIAQLSGIDLDVVQSIRKKVEQGQEIEASSLVSPEILGKVCAVGTPNEFREKVAQYRKAGSQSCLPIICPVAGDIRLAIESATS